jgi:hypothetical protein
MFSLYFNWKFLLKFADVFFFFVDIYSCLNCECDWWCWIAIDWVNWAFEMLVKNLVCKLDENVWFVCVYIYMV